MKLSELKFVPCKKEPDVVSGEQVQKYLGELKEWSLEENKIKKVFKFPDFKIAMHFVNEVAAIAERESHHPDIFISYNEVQITLWTHRVSGLSLNDFILAVKIDEV